jgi:hypothetical protein
MLFLSTKKKLRECKKSVRDCQRVRLPANYHRSAAAAQRAGVMLVRTAINVGTFASAHQKAAVDRGRLQPFGKNLEH